MALFIDLIIQTEVFRSYQTAKFLVPLLNRGDISKLLNGEVIGSFYYTEEVFRSYQTG